MLLEAFGKEKGKEGREDVGRFFLGCILPQQFRGVIADGSFFSVGQAQVYHEKDRLLLYGIRLWAGTYFQRLVFV